MKSQDEMTNPDGDIKQNASWDWSVALFLSVWKVQALLGLY